MAYLNEEQRETLLKELSSMSFNQANGKLRRMDDHGRLAYYRNAQQTGRWLTRYELTGLGTRVTLVEKHFDTPGKTTNRVKSQFEFLEVIVEPTADNQS